MTIRERYRDIRQIDWEAEKRMYKLGIVFLLIFLINSLKLQKLFLKHLIR